MRTRTTAVAGMLAGSLLLAACGGTDTTDTTDTATAGGAAASSGSPAPSAAHDGFNDADVAFVAGMKPHHEQAVEMADMVLGTDPSPPVAALAERIKADQQPQIDQLDDMLDRFGADASVEGGHGDHDAGPAMAGHGGMMTGGQMRAMADATGDDATRMFLTMMIEHHEGAVAAAETELQDGEHQPALDLAREIRDSQAAEIAEMEGLLADL